MTTVDLYPDGPFDLRQSIDFGFGQREARPDHDAMRLAFVLDGYHEHAGVAVEQLASGALRMEVSGTEDVEAATRQAARVLSVDVDARGWEQLGRHDALIGRLQAVRPGLRPPLFYSAYEALAWAVLSARRPHAQMAALRERLAAEHGEVLRVGGSDLPALPTPEQMLRVTKFPQLPETKLHRLHGVARAALAGDLDTAALRAKPSETVVADLQRLEGIGPFYAELVTVRALGHTDVLPALEPRVLGIAGDLLGLGQPMTLDAFTRLAEDWKPWRTWAAVSLRAAGPSLV